VPRAPSAAVLVIEGLEDARAIDAMSTALTSPYEVTGAAHLPADVGGGRSSGGTALTLLRIEGFAESISYRTRALRHMLAGFGAATTLDAEEGAAAFADLRDGKPLAAQDAAVWRLSVKPGLGAQAVAAIRAQRSARAYYDWGGGLIWLATGLEGDAGASAIRAAAKAAEGYATLIRAPESLRVVVPVFEPETAALAALTKRVKAASDPEGIFNPGLMFAGI
jgi:glycolate oxidase FAD binding subunit